MAKGCWIARAEVSDPEQYAKYAAANGAAYEAYGARILVRGSTYDAKEGESRSRNVIVEFPSYADALACYESEAYQSAREFRLGAALLDLIVIEGYDGPQPGE